MVREIILRSLVRELGGTNIEYINLDGSKLGYDMIRSVP
jgi:hypothetical protein